MIAPLFSICRNYRRIRQPALALSLFLVGCALSAHAETFEYQNGETRSEAIVLSDANNELIVDSGTATQAGAISVQPGGDEIFLYKEGDGGLIFSAPVTIPVDNYFSIHGGSATFTAAGSLIDYLTIDNSSGGVAVARVTGSGTVENGTTYIANDGEGRLEVVGGGFFDAYSTNMGYAATASASILVSGATSLFRTEYLEMGDGGQAEITLNEGGRLTFTSESDLIYLGTQETSHGTLNLGNASGETAAAAAGILDATGLEGRTGGGTLVFNHSQDDYALTRDGTEGGDAVLLSGNIALRVEHGTTVLTGANTHTGDTTVTGGTLRLSDVGASASVLGTGGLEIEAGGNVEGNGTVLGDATVAGRLAPGESIGQLNFDGDLTLESTAVAVMEIGSLSGFDVINVREAFTFGGTLEIAFTDGFTPEPGASFDLFTFGSRSGDFSQILFELPDYSGTLSYNGGVATLTIATIPEPSAEALLISLLAGAALFARRRSYSRQ
ncbi:MAG TPA: autotransporter-associated beta strand repeat-containing protein [Chthoniobacteraceae bacterium]|nr:autotransporter-associated beta strand repeat-containing protein [Chthoniobacteraceae bacterium]